MDKIPPMSSELFNQIGCLMGVATLCIMCIIAEWGGAMRRRARDVAANRPATRPAHGDEASGEREGGE